MKLAPEQWHTLSVLLDEALALPESERAAWLATLADEHAPLKGLLDEVFGCGARAATADGLGTLPGFTPMREVPDWEAGARVGPYRLIREIGRGGMGAVWLAERTDGLLKRQVALKLPMLAISRQALAGRFARERDILASLEHPHIARLYDAGFDDDGQPYLALEYVVGEPINQYCDNKRLSVAARIALFLDVIAAVSYVHANLILHRDLKPSNILVTPDGAIKVLDFGIAKLTAEGTTQETALTRVGGRALTPDYAAPEQISGAPLTTAADVYMLGVLLYELLTGQRPYRLKSSMRAALEHAILSEDIRRPSTVVATAEAAAKRDTTPPRLARQLDGDLDTVLQKALRKEPRARYASAEALGDDLQRYLAGRPVLARPDSAWYRACKFLARNRLPVAASAAVATALVGGASVALWQAHVARTESARANASKAFVGQLFQSAARGNPGGAAAADTTARQLLDIGSRELLANAPADPELELDLLQWLARLNSELDLLEPAAHLSDRSVALARELHGDQSVQLAEALVQKADNVFRAAGYTEAIDVAQRALAIADRQAARTPELRARAHLLIGSSQFQLDSSKTAEPQQHLESAVTLLRSVKARTEDRSRAAYYLAFIMEAQRKFAEAEAWYRDGIAEGTANFGERSFIVAFGYENLADLFRQQQRFGEAREAIDRALAIYEFVLGPRHGTVAFARTNLALIIAASGQREEAERLLDQSVALAERVFGEDARQVAFPATYAARIKAERGEFAAAARAYDRAIALYARVDPPTSRSTRNLQLEYARLLIAQGQLDQAAALLERAAVAYAAASDDAGAPGARLAIARAELAYARGDGGRGDASLGEAARQIDSLGAAANPMLPEFALAVARSHPGHASAETLLLRLDAAGLKPSSPDGLHVGAEDHARLACAVGRLLLADGQTGAAQMWLEDAVATRERIDAASSPWLAEAQIALAESLHDAGRDAEARVLLARASAIQMATPALGPTHRQSLRDVYALLGTRR